MTEPVVDNCPWCWAELGPGDIVCPACKQQARRTTPQRGESTMAPLSERVMPIPAARRADTIVTNPEKAPWWQRLLAGLGEFVRFLARMIGKMLQPWWLRW